ncbi:MAG: LptA/OstA family protein [Vicinamibacteria bacterium]
MSPPGTRGLRFALLGVALAVVAGVGVSLRRAPAPPPDPEGPAAEPSAGATPATRMDELVYRNVVGGRETFVLRAQRMRGSEQDQFSLESVDMEFHYTASGEPGTGRISSRACVYVPSRQEARFQGNVHLTTADGFEMTTESLVYLGQEGRASGEKEMAFRRKDLSGRSKGFDYESASGVVDLLDAVSLRIADEERPPLDVTARRGQFRRTAGEAAFEGEVVVVQGESRLLADELTLYGSEDQMDRLRASGQVRFSMPGAGALPGLPASSRKSGPRELSADTLDVDLQDRSLRGVVAQGSAKLVLSPGPGERRERRTLEGGLLGFHWNEQGQLSDVVGQKDTLFTTEPLPPSTAGPRRVKSRRFVASMDPQTGEARRVDFFNAVEMESGSQLARGGAAFYEGEQRMLSFKDEPVLTDSVAGSRLEAGVIEMFPDSGNLRARYDLRYTVEPRAGAAGFGVFQSGGEPVQLSGLGFEYDGATRTARFFEGALLRSGKSEVRANEIRLRDGEPGQHWLQAQGQVASRIEPPAGAKAEATATRGSADAMLYEEAAGRITYTGSARIRQGEVETRSPTAVLHLSPDGRRLLRLDAGEPVEIDQGERRAKGTRAVYSPEERTIVVTGEGAELKEPAQQVRGRSLTFFIGEDRILVDGREEARTETIFRRAPPTPKP